MRKIFIIIAILYTTVGFSQENFNYTQTLDISAIKFNTDKQQYLSEEISIPSCIKQPFVAITPSLSFSHEINDAVILSYRSKEGKKWNEWQTITFDHHSESKNKIVGEQLYLSSTTVCIQFKVEGQAVIENCAFDCRFFFPEKTKKIDSPPFQSTKGIDEIDCNCPIPDIENRLDWCPNGNCPQDPTPTATTVTHLVVHHSAGSNSAPGGDWAAVVRSIWDYHTNSNGWDDVGYNYLIDPNGVIYEGRGNNIQGAHFSCMNGGTMGVCLLGNFNNVEPSSAMLNALTALMAWKACDIDQDPTESSYFALAPGVIQNLVGHRDGNNLDNSCTTTSCPGDNVYDVLPNLRNNIVNYVDDCTLDANSNLLILNLESNPTSPIENMQTSLSATVKNSGDAATNSAFDIHLTIDGDTIYTASGNNLNVQETTTVQTNYTFPSAGNYQFCVFADAPNNELNSLNNSFCKTITVQTEPISAINDLTSIGVTIFPHPVKNILNITAKDDITRLVLKNTLGQIILEKHELPKENQIDISSFTQGLYLLEIQIIDDFAIQKIIKE